jgi:hypothetical protein
MFAITLIFVYSRQENSRGYAELKIAKLADKKFMTFAGADGTGHLSAVPPGLHRDASGRDHSFSVTESVDANNAYWRFISAS